MKRALSLAIVLAIASAKPEMYKEKEDFQYSRSSTDEGSKSGFYGAQRGNMGGNYERAHNMDGLAQHQMSGLVSQVDGELGDAANTKTGSVFTSANSRGIYGSGRYDLSNLKGRNFQESSAFDNAQSLSSQSAHNADFNSQVSSSMHNSGYNSLHNSESSRYTGYRGSNNNGQTLHAGNLQAAENVRGADTYDYNRQVASHSSGHIAQSEYQSQSAYDSSHTNLQSSDSYRLNPQSRLIVATPVRIYGRPGSRVAIPVGVQTYDATHSSSTLDQNAINSDAEVISSADQKTNFRPTSNAKRYESSYSYRKQWEKHDTKPEVIALAAPTDNPFPKNSELYDDNQALTSSNRKYQASGLNSHLADSSLAYSGSNSNVKSSSSQSRYQADAESQHRSSSDFNSNAHGAHYSGAPVDANILVGVDSKPKSYQSSYSYHKSWERQGDPYEIKPVGGAYTGQSSQKLTDASNSGAYSSHQYGSQYHKAHQSYSQGAEDCDCDITGHVRVARSYDLNQNQYNMQNLIQSQLEQQKDLGQQANNAWSKLEDLQQQQQNQIEWDRIEDLGQQTQNKWDNFEDVGQQTQNKWDNLEDVGQQTQNKWDNLEDVGQQTQNKWGKLEDVGQQTQNKWDKLEDLGQQTQNKLEDLGQQIQNGWDQVDTQQQQNLNTWNNLENPEQQESKNSYSNDNRWDDIHLRENMSNSKNSELNQQVDDSFPKLSSLLVKYPYHTSTETNDSAIKIKQLLHQVVHKHAKKQQIIKADQRSQLNTDPNPKGFIISWLALEIYGTEPNKMLGNMTFNTRTTTSRNTNSNDFYRRFDSLVNIDRNQNHTDISDDNLLSTKETYARESMMESQLSDLHENPGLHIISDNFAIALERGLRNHKT